MKTLIALLALPTLSLITLFPKSTGNQQKEELMESEDSLEVVIDEGWEWII